MNGKTISLVLLVVASWSWADGPASKPAALSGSSSPEPSYSYLGQPISKAKFYELYQQYGKKMIVVDGKLLDIGAALLTKQVTAIAKHVDPKQVPMIDAQIPDIGAIRRTKGQMQSVAKNYAIVHIEAFTPTVTGDVDPHDRFTSIQAAILATPSVTYRIRGLDTSKYVDGANIGNITIIYVGNCNEEGQTMQDYIVSASIPTEQQFADAIAAGLQLQTWHLENRKPVAKPVNVAASPVVEAELGDDDKARSKLGLAQNYISAGLPTRAMEVLKNIIAKYPQTPTAELARKKMNELGDTSQPAK